MTNSCSPLTPEKVTLRHLLTQQAGKLGLTKTAIDMLSAESQITKWREGARIVAPEDAHDLLHFIVAGVVKVTCQGPVGAPLIVQFSAPGQFIHTGWLFEGRPRRRKFTVTAQKDTTIAVMSQEVVTHVITSLPPAQALRLTIYGLRALSSLLQEKCFLLRMTLEDRLLHELHILARDFGRSHEEGVLIDLRITNEDLGELVAASQHNVSRCMMRLKRAGHLRTAGRLVILARRTTVSPATD